MPNTCSVFSSQSNQYGTKLGIKYLDFTKHHEQHSILIQELENVG